MGEITMTELAQRLGLGKSTVHRALSGSGKIDPETRRQVLEAAEMWGYERNLYFAALVSQRKRSAGDKLTIHYIDRNLPRGNPQSKGKKETGLMDGVARSLGMELITIDPSLDKHPHLLPRVLWHQGSSGFLLGNCGSEFIRGLDKDLHLPILSLMTSDSLPYHQVGFDMSKAVRMCWQKLKDAGYRRIGCAVMQHTPPNQDDSLRLGAALAISSEELPMEQRIPPLTAPLLGNDEFILWINTYQPEAVIGFSTGGYWHCPKSRNPYIPYVALHAGDRSESIHVPGTYQPWSVHARNAIRLLDTMIRNGDCGIPVNRYSLLIDPVWHPGEGIAPCRAKA